MSSATDTELLALHGLAVKKAGSPAAVAVVVGADEGEIEASLEAAVAAGRAAGAKGTFMVSPAGREWLDEHIHSQGRKYPPQELLRRATGSTIDAKPYLAYLTRKYGAPVAA